MSKICIIDTDYKKIQSDIAKIFACFNFDFRGKKVFLKPNLLAACLPERGVTTHPKVVEAVTRYLKGCGASVVVGDNSGMRTAYGNNEAIAKVCGIYDAALGSYRNIGSNGVRVKTKFKECPEITISREVFECDYFISLPKFKTHLNALISGAVKNSYGLVVGAEKMRLHGLFPEYDKFAEVIVEIFKMRPPDMVIMDAIQGMEGDGPNSPYLREINKVIASDDAVSLDTVVCQMMGMDPDYVNTIRLARREGLGEADISKITIIGTYARIPGFKLPATYRKARARDSFLGKFFSQMVGGVKLRVDRLLCDRCGQCVQHCPVKAISFEDKPRINHRKCVGCFCCAEICPRHAINMRGVMGILENLGSKRMAIK